MKSLFVSLLIVVSCTSAYADLCDSQRQSVTFMIEQCLLRADIKCINPDNGEQVGTVKHIVTSSRNVETGSTVYTCFMTECDGVTPGHAVLSTILGACGSNTSASGSNDSPNSPRQCGSIIDVENRVLIETAPIVGTSIGLTYSSRFVQGRVRDYKIRVPVTMTNPKPVVSGYRVDVRSTGGVLLDSQSFTTAPGQEYSFVWNGLNDSLISTLGPQKFNVVVFEYATDFNSEIPQEVVSGSFKAKLLGLGGWVPSNWKYYSHLAGKVFEGDGSFRSVTAVDDGVYKRIASEDASLVHYFDSEGKLALTKTGLTGTTIETFSYDSNGRLSAITESFGRVTTFNRDSLGNLVSITAPNGKVTVVSLNIDGWLESVTNPNSETHQMTYLGTDGLLGTFTKPNSAISTFTYNSEGELVTDLHSGGSSIGLSQISNGISSTSAMGRVSEYSLVNSTHTIKRPDLTTVSHEISSSRNKITDRGHTYDHAYSTDLRFGSQSKMLNYVSESGLSSRVFNVTNSVTLSNSSNPFSVVTYNTQARRNSSSPIFSSTYTGSSRTFSTLSPLGKTSTKQIDEYERTISSQFADRTPIQFSYTGDKLTSITQGGRVSSFSYDSLTGLLASSTNPIGQTSLYTYDSSERLVSITTPDLKVTGFGYDSVGNGISVTPPGRPSHVFSFNSSEVLSGYNPPPLSPSGSFNTTYSYNLDRQLTAITKPSGQTISYTYSPTAGRLQKITSPAGNHTFTYGSGTSSRLDSVLPPSGYLSYVTWAGGVPNQVSLRDTSSRQIFNIAQVSTAAANGKPTSETVSYYSAPASAIAFGYDNDEFLTSAGSLSISRNATNGDILGTVIGQVTTSHTVSTFGESLGSEAISTSAGTLFSEQFTRDDLGRVTTATLNLLGSPSIQAEYIYDLAGRLVEVMENSVVTSTYIYDDNGNRVSGNVAGVSTSASYNDQDQVTAYNTYNYTYDANGNLASKTNTLTSETWTYTYDVFGSLTQVITPTASITYRTDAFNRRMSKSVNGVVERYYMYDLSGRLIAELNNAAIPVPIRRYVYATQSHSPDYYIEGGVNYRIVKDHLGSPRVVVNSATGTIVQQMNHDEFGRVLLDTAPKATAIGFAGGLYDPDTGLVRFGARDYDPEVGRWTSKDPILFAGGDTNLYGYTFNDPINFIDPRGLAPGDPFYSEGEAAGDAINYINPTSVSQNREYGGYIVQNPDGSYSATPPVKGGPAGVNLGPVPPGAGGSYHTHGAYDPNYNNENFSGGDILGDAFSGLNGYLGTPGGSIQKNSGGKIKKGLSCP